MLPRPTAKLRQESRNSIGLSHSPLSVSLTPDPANRDDHWSWIKYWSQHPRVSRCPMCHLMYLCPPLHIRFLSLSLASPWRPAGGPGPRGQYCYCSHPAEENSSFVFLGEHENNRSLAPKRVFFLLHWKADACCVWKSPQLCNRQEGQEGQN